MKKQCGMTLVEMIIAIALMGIAMVALSSFLIPQIRDSAMPHYQTRATALGHSFMSQIVARGFDENSDFDGGFVRCGEGAAGSQQEVCTLPSDLGPEPGEFIPEHFNDVDDYIGCWNTPTTVEQCQGTNRGHISGVLGGSSEDKYRNFRVEVAVAYYNITADGSPPIKSADVTAYKKITVTIFAGNAQPLTLTGIRGNY